MAMSRRWHRGGLASLLAAALAFAAHALHAQPASPLLLIDALREALKRNPDTRLQEQQVVFNRGAVLAAESRFDPLYSASMTRQRDLRPLRADEINALRAARRVGLTDQTTDYTVWSGGVARTLENGVVLGGNVSVTRTDDSFNQLASIPAQTLGRLNFVLAVPLMKNSGRDVVGAERDAADAEHRAALRELAHANAQTLLSTTQAYWEYLAAMRRLEIANNAEARARALVLEMEKLVRADQVPRADLELLHGSRADKTALRLAAEQALEESRRALARLIGLPADAALALALPGDDFPAFEPASLPGGDAGRALSGAALRQRADLAAGRLREQAARLRLAAARNNLKPQVDVSLNAGYVTLAEGRGPFDQQLLYQGRSGPTFAATLSYQFAGGNAAARGALLEQSALLDAATIRLRELEAGIGNAVPVQLEALRRAATQLADGDEAVRRYATALRNEETKRRLGRSTLIDVLNVQDRLDNAQARQVQLRQGYAAAIAQLRFTSGALVRQAGDTFDVRIQDLTAGDFRVD
jgi:outer membrane protein TolC